MKYGISIVKLRTGEPLPPDEPIFIFRARDRNAIRALRAYHAACVEDGCLPEHIQGVLDSTRRFEAFAREHPNRMKQPGITRSK